VVNPGSLRLGIVLHVLANSLGILVTLISVVSAGGS
jgi:hypothetical protein